MIADRLQNWQRYFSEDTWRIAFDYLQHLDPNTAEGFYDLQGKDIYARVMSYDTVTENEAILESHRTYIDIQSSVIHDERIDWFPLDGLQVKTEYNSEKDATYYHRPDSALASVVVKPGMFVVLFPTDAHMPKLITDTQHRMKKVVVKLRASLIGQS